jgi:hypothetical protein
MKKTFTKDYIIQNKGCYDLEQVEKIKCINDKKITLKQLFNDLPIKDFSWFLVRKCELTTLEKQFFALHCAKQVLPIYEAKNPNDKRVSECIEATERYLNGKISIDELMDKRSAAAYAADAASYASYAADAASYASYAATAATAADAAAYADDAADAAYAADASYAAYAADAAAYAAAYAAYKQSIWKFVETLK